MTSIRIKAFAKVNTYLKILSKRPDGFHDIDTIMQNISLYDVISITESDKGIFVESDDLSIPSGEGNICHKAAARMLDISGRRGVSIKIDKKIPSGAGLGGGSSDAAAVIRALDKLWALALDKNTMMHIAADIGSDVPFFIEGGRARCRGRGEAVEKLRDSDEQYLVLIKPEESVPTKWAYEEFDKLSAVPDYKCFGSKEGGMVCSRTPQAYYENDFEKVILPKYPGIKKAKDLLISAGAGTALMTGSGSAVFGVVGNKTHADDILSKVKEVYSKSYSVHTISRAFDFLA